MTRGVDYPGRGPTWLGVPALVAVLVGALILIEVLTRQGLSRDLLRSGIETTADSVQLVVYPGKGDPLVEDISVKFRTADGAVVRAKLQRNEDDPQGMSEGEQAPAAGTRYAMPLELLYRPSDPSIVLASVDAREWSADRETPRIGTAVLAGGLAGVLLAAILLTRGARKRGLAWWRWYSEAPRHAAS
ncbi:hypothetical protein F1D05_33290 [Kribbella qitaiheensis]|uniref:DUF3592 domain-containing protein n=1 Tax=Kribbella qitaiheensis TaxID=1544730 RepID=A0A7G6X6N6_9ACTN|nr:DUF3592 domain-containing protein [Kribbella qitaiheensis]QNE21901.1 hypothetical protein F1D05_33290 [Kribbella qitaiheensis]